MAATVRAQAARRRRAVLTLAAVALAILVLTVAIGGGLLAPFGLGSRPFVLVDGPPPLFGPVDSGTEVLLGAGDIARCDSEGDEATARLLDALAGTVFTLGDNVYEHGSPEEFARCYHPSWGRHRDRTRFPVAGNHDWARPDAAGYRAYFGERAAPHGVTWYAADAGSWRVIVLDSECDRVGGCGDGAVQHAWLAAELAANTRACTIVLVHHPLFSSGHHGGAEEVRPFWRLLHAAGVDVVVAAHDHTYERFGRQDPDGRPDPDRGIRQFVVGTGGGHLRGFRGPQPNSEVRAAGTHGILRLELAIDGYRWDFVPVAGSTFTDSGTGACH